MIELRYMDGVLQQLILGEWRDVPNLTHYWDNQTQPELFNDQPMGLRPTKAKTDE